MQKPQRISTTKANVIPSQSWLSCDQIAGSFPLILGKHSTWYTSSRGATRTCVNSDVRAETGDVWLSQVTCSFPF
ncbi:hypothetical protein RRG08_000591 [Elysia crispata]|uniref:Uncharacterized protein n=1 Tax=Elysia crispata TaxID=231223 RepID=A0AAE0Y8A7_9GAST|nr:hypothetical protein RRG08_000591 [Elysia crispata]